MTHAKTSAGGSDGDFLFTTKRSDRVSRSLLNVGMKGRRSGVSQKKRTVETEKNSSVHRKTQPAGLECWTSTVAKPSKKEEVKKGIPTNLKKNTSIGVRNMSEPRGVGGGPRQRAAIEPETPKWSNCAPQFCKKLNGQTWGQESKQNLVF